MWGKQRFWKVPNASLMSLQMMESVEMGESRFFVVSMDQFMEGNVRVAIGSPSPSPSPSPTS
jgi:hypothetical protein